MSSVYFGCSDVVKWEDSFVQTCRVPYGVLSDKVKICPTAEGLVGSSIGDGELGEQRRRNTVRRSRWKGRVARMQKVTADESQLKCA